MIFSEAPIKGLFVVHGDTVSDERGDFIRVFSADEFETHGLDRRVSQSSVSHNPSRYTLRGLHYQRHPYQEAKLVRCVRGRLFDVVVDLRPGSTTYCRWYGMELSADDPEMLYVPEGCAHGFLTLERDTGVHYQISMPYSPEHASGVRWDDQAFSIVWPEEPRLMSEKDRGYEDFKP